TIVYMCAAQATFVAAQEEKILPRYGDGPQSSLGDIVIYGETAVASVARKCLPTALRLYWSALPIVLFSDSRRRSSSSQPLSSINSGPERACRSASLTSAGLPLISASMADSAPIPRSPSLPPRDLVPAQTAAKHPPP